MLQKSALSPVEAHQLRVSKVRKLEAQYLGDNTFWNDKAKQILTKNKDINTIQITRFIRSVCDHLYARFPADELKCCSEIADIAINDEQFNLLSMLFDICSTFQASSADCKRGFSLMNNIKVKSRCRLDQGFPKCSVRSPRAMQEKLRGSAREGQKLRKQRVQTRSFLSGSRSPFHNGNTNVQRSVFSSYRATSIQRS